MCFRALVGTGTFPLFVEDVAFCRCSDYSIFVFPYRYHGNSDEVGCFVAARPLTRRNRYFEVGDVWVFFTS